jgi:hypothetical protein
VSLFLFAKMSLGEGLIFLKARLHGISEQGHFKDKISVNTFKQT